MSRSSARFAASSSGPLDWPRGRGPIQTVVVLTAQLVLRLFLWPCASVSDVLHLVNDDILMPISRMTAVLRLMAMWTERVIDDETYANAVRLKDAISPANIEAVAELGLVEEYDQAH